MTSIRRIHVDPMSFVPKAQDDGSQWHNHNQERLQEHTRLRGGKVDLAAAKLENIKKTVALDSGALTKKAKAVSAFQLGRDTKKL